MSAKPRKPRAAAAAKKQVEEKAPVKTPEIQRPKGPAPSAFVSARHEGETVSRLGRGFSLGELTATQFPLNLAKRWGLQVDLRRRSVIGSNVASVKAWMSQPKPAKPEGEARRLEGELVKVEKEVKKEVKKVEKEIVAKVEEPVKKRISRKKAALKKRS